MLHTTEVVINSLSNWYKLSNYIKYEPNVCIRTNTGYGSEPVSSIRTYVADMFREKTITHKV
jgi:hypothetical protein